MIILRISHILDTFIQYSRSIEIPPGLFIYELGTGKRWKVSGILKWGRLSSGAQAEAVPRLTEMADGRRLPHAGCFYIQYLKTHAVCWGESQEAVPVQTAIFLFASAALFRRRINTGNGLHLSCFQIL